MVATAADAGAGDGLVEPLKLVQACSSGGESDELRFIADDTEWRAIFLVGLGFSLGSRFKVIDLYSGDMKFGLKSTTWE